LCGVRVARLRFGAFTKPALSVYNSSFAEFSFFGPLGDLFDFISKKPGEEAEFVELGKIGK